MATLHGADQADDDDSQAVTSQNQENEQRAQASEELENAAANDDDDAVKAEVEPVTSSLHDSAEAVASAEPEVRGVRLNCGVLSLPAPGHVTCFLLVDTLQPAFFTLGSFLL